MNASNQEIFDLLNAAVGGKLKQEHMPIITKALEIVKPHMQNGGINDKMFADLGSAFNLDKDKLKEESIKFKEQAIQQLYTQQNTSAGTEVTLEATLEATPDEPSPK